jgi:signal transduction histidine kinase
MASKRIRALWVIGGSRGAREMGAAFERHGIDAAQVGSIEEALRSLDGVEAMVVDGGDLEVSRRVRDRAPGLPVVVLGRASGRVGDAVVADRNDPDGVAAAVRAAVERSPSIAAALQPLLDALTLELALIDDAGVVAAVNREWSIAREVAPLFGSQAPVGTNLLQALDRAAGHGQENARELAQGIRDVAARRRDLHLQDIAMGLLERRDSRLRAAPFGGEGAVRVVLTIEDVTERRQLEQQFHQAQKMEAMGRLAGGVAHDFNNLLTAITGYSQLLLSSLPAGDPSRSDIEEIKKAGDRAAALVGQLMAFSRRQVREAKVVDLNGVIRNMEAMLRRLIGEDVELMAQLAGDLGRVKADPGQLEQVVMNLAVNARDAMPQGGRLTISTANVSLSETDARSRYHAQAGPHVVLSVTDTGLGMPPEVQAHLFEPFFTTKEPGKGTGLGLPTVYGIVTQSGGHIEVETAPGEGTSFRIFLPRVDSPVSPDTPRPSGPGGRGSETVLLAEDDQAVRRLVSKVLQSGGYTVLEANSGVQAIELCRNHPDRIHLLIADVVMPGMSGMDLARQMRALRLDLRVLFVSGHTESGVRRRGVVDPKIVVLKKPFEPDALLRRVRELLGAPSP